MTSEELTIFKHLCAHDVGIMDSWIPLPSTFLSQISGFSLYKTRKILKSLKGRGLIVSDRYNEKTEDGFVIFCNGYVLTNAGRKTDAYCEAYEKERKIVLETMNFDMGELSND